MNVRLKNAYIKLIFSDLLSFTCNSIKLNYSFKDILHFLSISLYLYACMYACANAHKCVGMNICISVNAIVQIQKKRFL